MRDLDEVEKLGEALGNTAVEGGTAGDDWMRNNAARDAGAMSRAGRSFGAVKCFPGQTARGYRRPQIPKER